MSSELRFKISSALKDIIGRDLITDDFIAVFELVKNSFDAHASQVDIYFKDIYGNHPKIIIQDNGKGMSFDDLTEKWLFVAYSAKRDGSEDENFDYRDKILSRRAYAGAKGIGRFSCDRLGKSLYLETKKNEINSQTEILITNWENFEKNLKDNFVDISVIHDTTDTGNYEIEHGTVLEISDLRSPWDRTKFLKLKDSLAKLINPGKRSNNEQNFRIVLHADEELNNDSRKNEYYEKVNGPVQNFIFDTLGLKTTRINSYISNDGKYTTTELRDGGTLIYRIKEENKYKLLYNVDFTIYYLNKSAKLTFARRMGINSVNYGHIFLYKNGFRIYPYGEPGEDPLKIDVRKSQGHRRYLGTRELMGQIEIYNDSDQLKETSSRGDGLIKTPTYNQIEAAFWETLKRLERYVVDVQQWGLSIEDNDKENNAVKNRIIDLIAKLTGSDNIIEFEYPDEFLDILESSQSNSNLKAIENLTRIANLSGDNSLIAQVKRTAENFNKLSKLKDDLEQENKSIKTENEEIKESLILVKKENELLKEASNEEVVELMVIEHHVYQASFRIDEHIDDLNLIAEKTQFKNEIINLIEKISLENKKIGSLVKFVRNSNVDLLSSYVTEDLALYITQYIDKVYNKDKIRIINKKIIKNISTSIDQNSNYTIKFVPLEINIIVDNLLDNSFKASATDVSITFTEKDEKLVIDYNDNGIGIPERVKDNLFDFGITTTGGSGIGLFHIKKILNQMGGTISLIDTTAGANFIMIIPKSYGAKSTMV